MNSGKFTKKFLQVRSLTWRLKTHLGKAFIRWEDRHGGLNYQAWLRTRQPDPSALSNQHEQWNNFAYQPLFSIFLSGGDVPSAQATLISLTNNSYPRWEAFWLVNQTGLSAAEVDPLIAQYPDLRLIDSQNLPHGDPSRMLNPAHGDYLAVLQAGDLLAPHTLFALVESLNSNSKPEIIYFDEDQRTPDGKSSFNPFLKPDWSPELLLSINYLTRAFFDTALLKEESSKSEMFPEAVYSLAFRAAKVVHIPQILCHALEDPSLPKTEPSTMHALSKALSDKYSLPIQARKDEGKVRITLPAPEVLVSIIIPTKDRVHFLRSCINTLMEITQYQNYEIIIIDNGSSEPEAVRYLKELRKQPQVLVVENPTEFNFSAFNNLGADRARGEVLLFLNNDIEVIEPDWLDEMLQWALLPEIGVVGAKLLYPDRTIQHAGVVIGMEGHASHIFYGLPEGVDTPFGSMNWYRNLSAVTGACLMMRREVFDQVGRFDEKYFLAFSDIELCLRSLQAGYRVVYTPYARLIHHEGRTRARHIPAGDIHLAYQQLRKYIEVGDPYYNPNLSYSVCRPTLRRQNEPNPLQRLEQIISYTP